MRGLIFLVVSMFLFQVSADHKFIEMMPPKVKKNFDNQLTRTKDIRDAKAKGYIGETEKGLLAIRELKGAKADEKKKIEKLVADENKDRQAIFEEIVRFNKLTERERGFLYRSTFETLRAIDLKGSFYYEKNRWEKKH